MSSRLRVLHVEDVLADAELVQETLATEGISCEITRVQTEADFISALKQSKFDLILADYTLPSFDGLSALKIAQRLCPELPFIFVSGTLGEHVAIESLKIGATDYILKTHLSRLGSSVKRALREARERTELRRSEVALRRSEAYLAMAQSLSHTGSFGWHIATGEIFWSLETYRIFELDPDTRPTPEAIRQRVHPDDQVRREQILNQIAQGCLEPNSTDTTLNQDFHYEHRLLMPDGRVKHLRVSGRVVRDSLGDTEFVGAITDVTEAKRAERELREREAKIRRLVDANIIGIFLWDFKGTILEANDEFLRIVGYDRDDLDAGRMRWTDLTPPEWLIVDEQKWVPELKKTGSLQPFEKEYFRKDGSRVPVLIGVATIDEDESEGLAFVLDLTERKRAEESLAFSSFALNNVQESAFLVDEKRRFHYVNAEACRSLGYSREELLGMGVQDIDPDFPMERWPDHWAALKSKRSLTFESRHRAKNGRVFPVELNSNYFEYGGKAYILGLARDISERKHAEEVRLEARVAERMRIARDLHDTLLQSFHGLLLRFQTVSHLLPDRPLEAKEKLEHAIAQAADAITEGRDAVQGLRDSTIQDNNLAQAINTLGNELANSTGILSPATFHVSSEGKSRNLHPLTRDDIYKIAAEAMRNVFRHADAQHIMVEVFYGDEQFRMLVRDDGKGITPAVLSGDGAEGHYGLAGMRERATIIGGTLDVRSKVGEGTEVELCIPARKVYAATESSSHSGNTPEKHR
jgi:PAS domain S-box-containing protein